MDESATQREHFSRYYARYLVAKRGYRLGALPRSEELLQHCDYVLTSSAGKRISIVGIVNRDSAEGKTFTMPAQDLAALARHVAGSLPAAARLAITIYEIGSCAIGRADKSRLSRHRSHGKNYATKAIAVDVSKRRAWPLPLFGRRFSPAGQMEKLLRAPRLSAAELSGPERAVKSGRPVFVWVLMALLAAVFIAEQVFTFGKTGKPAVPTIETLQVLGGLSYPLVVGEGQWWRLFTAPLLHGDVTHIGFNCLVLLLIGNPLETLIGWRWTAATFSVSAVGGSLMSLAANPVNMVSVGASGGITGMLATALVISFRIPAGAARARLVSQAIYGLVPALLPFLNTAVSGGNIDYGAHFGGAIGGVTVGFLLLGLWPGRLPRPRMGNLAALVAIAFFSIAAGACLPIREHYARQMLLAPDLPAATASSDAAVESLLRAYPRDPRLFFLRAQALLRRNDIQGAERDLRAALADRQLIAEVGGSDFENRVRAVLAALLKNKGEPSEAAAMAGPACAVEKSGPIADYLTKFSLCR
ncbi:rhomboid family intramembrane serine protease [Labrys okinawensis]|nr:rhomboid family intramembrane serine protease [Labrys okinawensis]